MWQVIGSDVGSYAFDASARTLTISGVTFTLEQIVRINNSTRGITLYLPYDSDTQITLAGSVITFEMNTERDMADTDRIQAIIDLPGIRLQDSTGASFGLKLADGKPRISSMSYSYDIAEGNITGHTAWSKIGINDAVGVTEEEMWPVSAPYVFPTAAGKWFVSSASDTDNGAAGQLKTVVLNAGGTGYHIGDVITITQAGGALGAVRVLTLGASDAVDTFEIYIPGTGYTVANGLATTVTPAGGADCLLNITAVSAAASTGARTVDIYYLDGSYVEKTVTRTLNGVTPVWIADDCFRMQNMRVKTTGTGLVPAGAISVIGSTVTYGYISLGRTRQRQCTWTVPYGKALYINSISFSCADQAAGKYCRFTNKANYDDKSATVLQRGLWMPYTEVYLNNQAYTRELLQPTKLPATVDLKVSVMANSAAVATCRLSGWIETA